MTYIMTYFLNTQGLTHDDFTWRTTRSRWTLQHLAQCLYSATLPFIPANHCAAPPSFQPIRLQEFVTWRWRKHSTVNTHINADTLVHQSPVRKLSAGPISGQHWYHLIKYWAVIGGNVGHMTADVRVCKGFTVCPLGRVYILEALACSTLQIAIRHALHRSYKSWLHYNTTTNNL